MLDDTDTIGAIVLVIVVAVFVAAKWQARKAKGGAMATENHPRRDAAIGRPYCGDYRCAHSVVVGADR